MFNELQLLSDKPVLYVCNVGDTDISGNAWTQAVGAMAKAEGAAVVTLCASLEADVAGLTDAAERDEFLAAHGWRETGLNRVIHAAYGLLDLITFFTAGPKETRAWTAPRGARAVDAAGSIHTDFARGFIRAEPIAYADYIACRGEAGAKAAGKMRLEGKEYVVQDADIIYFRFAL
jgi:ribosome-binding ATPase YchF (GTP1/OBG family)